MNGDINYYQRGPVYQEFVDIKVIIRNGKRQLNIVTIFLALAVGASMTADTFLKLETIKIIILGLLAFCMATAGGVLFGKIMCKTSGGEVNPLIGSAGVSAVPMAARVCQKVGADEDHGNFLLMHAMGPNVAGVIGSAVAAGVFLSVFGGPEAVANTALGTIALLNPLD